MKGLKTELENIICPAEEYEGLECDGMTRVLSYLLAKAGFDFQAYTGRLKSEGQEVLHYWIEVPYNTGGAFAKHFTIDLRARMWISHGMKDNDVPHGVFKQEYYPKIEYKKNKTIDLTPSTVLYNILTR